MMELIAERVAELRSQGLSRQAATQQAHREEVARLAIEWRCQSSERF